jgi:hypothetical protein
MGQIFSADILKVIVGITGPTSLIAGALYLLFVWLMKSREQDWKAIADIKDEKERIKFIREYLSQNGISLTGQPVDAQLVEYRNAFVERNKRFRIIAVLIFIFFLVVAGLAVFQIMWSAPSVDKHAMLRRLYLEANFEGIARLKNDENAYWLPYQDKLAQLKKCGDDKSCDTEEEMNFIKDKINDNTAGSKKQLDRVLRISDFYLSIADHVAKMDIDLAGACACFGAEVYKWQRSYLFALDKLSNSYGVNFQERMADFAIEKCKSFKESETCPVTDG